MTVLVTGASGFIGSHVVAALASSGAQVRAYDLREPQQLPAQADYAAGDLLDRERLGTALDGCEAVFHLAALYSYSPRDAAAME
ncbi:MAG TPA: NAD-dependent epimerase/dehydratase family protein, partial [Solirubrobacteraceae bacterium]|nr:NAD-dependent epimerase/dehydratase family protein [Solirubrobacteraceae bacterium]